MTRLDLKYIHRFKDRHGKVRHYFRRVGFPQVTLPGEVGSAEFINAYSAAMGQKKKPIKKYGEGTIGALIVAWYQWREFTNMAETTKVVYRNIAERFGAEYGHLRVSTLEPHHIDAILSKRSGKPAAANNLLKVLRKMMQFAVKAKWTAKNPTDGIEKLSNKTDGHHTWTEAEIEQFESRWPIGSRPRLAFALLLYTAQRRGDVIRMGKQHIQGGFMAIVQEKTGARLEIPVHSKLRAVIRATPSDHLTFLTTAAGAPFTSAGFGNLFREMCNDANLPHCSAHGLRKAASRRLAEAGCSANQIKAITGHASIAEVQRYTQAADQRNLATSAMAMVDLEEEDEDKNDE